MTESENPQLRETLRKMNNSRVELVDSVGQQGASGRRSVSRSGSGSRRTEHEEGSDETQDVFVNEKKGKIGVII